jgi:hypothetical protein
MEEKLPTRDRAIDAITKVILNHIKTKVTNKTPFPSNRKRFSNSLKLLFIAKYSLSIFTN